MQASLTADSPGTGCGARASGPDSGQLTNGRPVKRPRPPSSLNEGTENNTQGERERKKNVTGSEGVQMTVVADTASTGLALEVNMDVIMLPLVLSVTAKYVWTLWRMWRVSMEADKTVTDTTPDAAHTFHKADLKVSAQQKKQ